MRRKGIIILDRDDTLYSCNMHALNLLSKETGKKYDYFGINKWGLLNNELDKRLKFFSDPEFVLTQPLYKGAKEFVSTLVDMGYEVLICTNVPANVCPAVMQAILRDFPFLKPENVIFGAKKGLLRADFALDDSVSNIQNWGDNVKYPVLFKQPWNLSESGGLSVSSYEGFLGLLSVLETSRNSEKYDGVILVGSSGANKSRAAESFVKAGLTRVKSYSTRRGEDYLIAFKKDFEGNKGGFVEVSHYAGQYYGLKQSDIDAALSSGKVPLLVLDINGAVSLREKYNFLTVYVNETKENCVRNILQKDFSEDEKIKRICGLEREFACKNLCDEIYSSEEDIMRIVAKIKKGVF